MYHYEEIKMNFYIEPNKLSENANEVLVLKDSIHHVRNRVSEIATDIKFGISLKLALRASLSTICNNLEKIEKKSTGKP